MRFQTTYEINDLGISSSRYILNHLGDFLINKGFAISLKEDDNLVYRYKYWGLITTWSLASRCSSGLIKVIVNSDNIEIELKYSNYLLLFGVIVIIILGFQDLLRHYGIEELNFELIFTFSFLFGGNFIIRFFAQRKLFKQIKKIIENL